MSNKKNLAYRALKDGITSLAALLPWLPERYARQISPVLSKLEVALNVFEDSINAKIRDRENRLRLVKHLLEEVTAGLAGEDSRSVTFSSSDVLALRKAVSLRCRDWKLEV